MKGYSNTKGYIMPKFDNLTDYGLLDRIIAGEKGKKKNG